MPGTVRVEKEGPVGFVLFDYPERRNAISLSMWLEIPKAAATLRADESVRVVILRGAGDLAFVSGADISEFGQSRLGAGAGEYDAASIRAFQALENIDKPLIAMIHGFCLGGGVGIALTADFRYAASDAIFAIPAAKLGLGYPPAGIATLVRTVGPSAAKEIFFTARRFDAEEALSRRLIDEVKPKADLESYTREIAGRIAENAPLTMRSAKIAMRELGKPESERDRAAIDRSVEDCYASRDYEEGIVAFLEKRAPKFSGR